MKYDIPLKFSRKITLAAAPIKRYAQLRAHGAVLSDGSGDIEPCWIWTGSVQNAGYGQSKFNGKSWQTHRLLYHMRVEKLPAPGTARKLDGRILDHVCEVRLCCNPAHLEYIGQSENVKRGARWR